MHCPVRATSVSARLRPRQRASAPLASSIASECHSDIFCVFPLQYLHISEKSSTFAAAKVLIHGTGRSNPIIRLRTDSRSVG